MVGTETIGESTVVSRTESALATTLDGETVILETDSGTYFGLNEVATDIWEHLEEPQTVADLRDVVLEEYDVEPERCEEDLQNVLDEMTDLGLVALDDAS